MSCLNAVFCQYWLNVVLIECFLAWHEARWCSFIRMLIILPISPMYNFPQGILYILLKLSRDLWSLKFLKICSIFLGGLKRVRILFVQNVNSIYCSFYIWENRKTSSCFLLCISCFFLSCFTSFLYLFCCKICFKWLSSV